MSTPALAGERPARPRPTSEERLTVANQHLQAAYRRDSLVIVLLPAVGFVAALVWARTVGLTTLDWAMFGVMYLVTTAGIDVGYHRYFAHRSFEAAPAVRALLAVCGAMAAQGRLIRWVANHRRHHAYSDEREDTHSPLAGPWDEAARPGPLPRFFHSYVGWIFTHEPTNTFRFAKDILSDPLLAFLNRYYLGCLLLGAAMPAVTAWAVRGRASGLLEGVLWGWAAPVFLSQQAAFLVNSVAHLSGRQPFTSGDASRNVGWLALPSLGVSWHNNHHAFPNSAITRIEWWQVDLSGTIIRTLARLGLAWKLTIPTKEAIAARRRTA